MKEYKMKEEIFKIKIEGADESIGESEAFVDEDENLELNKTDLEEEISMENVNEVVKDENLELNKTDLEEEKVMENDNKTVVNDFNDDKLTYVGVEDEEMDLFFILDRSGSMYGSEEDTINGFNAFIEKQMSKNHKILVTTVLFDGKYEVLYSRKPISEVKPLTNKEYYVRGSTALLDAIGRTVNTFRGEVNQAMCIITTDGYENSSREFNRDQIRDMVENTGWEFVFIGADIDSYGEASRIGIRRSRVARHSKDAPGINNMYIAVDNLTTKFYHKRIKDDDVEWKKDLE